MKDLETAIDRIGQKMVVCNQKCKGMSCGVLPRCLILESAGRSGKGGCVMVGINPGHARAAEIAYYKKEGAKYETTVQYWHDAITPHPYYERLRKLTKAFGLNGPILWTELAKCENAAGIKFPPLKALRACTGRFLTEELKAIPLEWPLFGIGCEAYKALAYLYPARTVIGVPHPTGAYGKQFSRLLQLNSESKEVVCRALSSWGELLWLGDVGGKVEAKHHA
ncbi:MAG: hypothetical protein KKH28_08405 [Elusimicrobia bacterium]|nr:hypothetical protein [Elusimicrobiota bacterium]